MHLPRLGYYPLIKNTCVLSCLVSIAGYFGKTFNKEDLDKLLSETQDKGGLDAEKLSEYLEPVELIAELKENATVADIRNALRKGIPCAVTFQIRHKDSPPDSPFSANHMAVVVGISAQNIYLADTSFRRGQVPKVMPLKQLEQDWWASSDSDFWGHAIPEDRNIHRKILHLFYSASPAPENMVGKSIWENIKKMDRQFKIIECGEREIWKYIYDRDCGDIDLRLIFIDETAGTSSSP